MIDYIADIASNHNGSFIDLEKLIRACSICGVTTVKLQSFEASSLVNPKGFESISGIVSHQSEWKQSVFDSYQSAETPTDWLANLLEICHSLNLKLSTSPYSTILCEETASFVDTIKIGSGDIDHDDLLHSVGAQAKPVILSTGASTLRDIAHAMMYLRRFNIPVTILQCNTNYTCRRWFGKEELRMFYSNINLSTIAYYQKIFPWAKTGLSDHTLTYDSALAAVVIYGATCIEKHLTLSPLKSGQDHSFSITPDEWYTMCQTIKDASRELYPEMGLSEKILLVKDYAQYPDLIDCLIGTRRVGLSENEHESSVVQRRSIVARKRINQGELITTDNIQVLRPRPFNSIAASKIPAVIGRRVKISVEVGDFLQWDFIDDLE